MDKEVEALSQQKRIALIKSAKLWNDYQKEMVILHWTAGKMSAAEIGKLIGKSRNAVIGKAHRLGLECPPKPAPSKPKKPRIMATVMVTKKKKETTPTVLWFSDKPISIGELTELTCRSPSGYGSDGLMTYCGNMVFPGKAFCEGHCALYYVPPKPRDGRYRR
jgi:GcrA cell cycle regulator